MIDKRMVAYVSENIKKGYRPEAIYKVLTRNGYPKQNVIDTINFVLSTLGYKQEFSQVATQFQNPAQTKEKKAAKSDFIKKILEYRLILTFAGIGVFLFLLTITILILLMSGNSISEEDFSKGTTLQLEEKDEIMFGKRKMRADSVSQDSITLSVQGYPEKVNIAKGEEKKLDLNDDGVYDMNLEFREGLYIKKISEEKCTEDWDCTSWGECTKEGVQTRSCTDLNSCGTNVNMPKTSKNCTYQCTQDWSCGSWSECVDGTKTRTCNDLNKCNSTENKPYTNISCRSQIKNNCTENWNCTLWSECTDGIISRDCVDLNDCGTNEQKPDTIRNCTNTSCTENWECTDWSACVEGMRTRTCTETNDCENPANKPDTTQQCGCQEDWTCTNWSECTQGTQTRACTDSSDCGTTDDKPAEQQSCSNDVCEEHEGYIIVISDGEETRYNDTCEDDYTYTDYDCLGDTDFSNHICHATGWYLHREYHSRNARFSYH